MAFVESVISAVGFLSSIVGLAGSPLLVVSAVQIAKPEIDSWRARKFIPVDTRPGVLDVVVTTSDRRENPRGKARGLAGHGALVSIEKTTHFLRRCFDKRTMKIHVACSVEDSITELSDDLILIGGPSKNEVAKKFLAALSHEYASQGSLIAGPDDRYLQFLGTYYPPNPAINPINGEVPETAFLDANREPVYDYGVILSAPNVMKGSGRVVLVYGFSSEGTARAGTWLFESVWSKKLGTLFRKAQAQVKNADGFIMIFCLRRNGEDLMIRPQDVVFKPLHKPTALPERILSVA
ncbi:MAG TPA: hypothetical protein VGO52_26150 [Hyphomonadaceae bacterium]|nr:hypothetical protein [Hyphomonadaceae bacterium]